MRRLGENFAGFDVAVLFASGGVEVEVYRQGTGWGEGAGLFWARCFSGGYCRPMVTPVTVKRAGARRRTRGAGLF